MPVGTAAAMKGIFHRDVEQEAKAQKTPFAAAPLKKEEKKI